METAAGEVYSSATAGLDTIEIPFYYLGLNTVPKRFLAGTLGTGAALFALKPSIMFFEDGSARPWVLGSSEEGAVVVPWWLLSISMGTILATFI